MDYDLWLRIAKKYEPKMINTNYAYFTWHADQKSSPKDTIRQIVEIDAILSENNARVYNRLRHIAKKSVYLIKSMIKYGLLGTGIVDKKYQNMPLSAKKFK